ncbi:cytochrome b561/ferric reductase transmembrane with DOMON related domain-containing protein [Artemisia annua]|uniref:Cytochrome b561/ferric reductase transmembrane with DOMON related domain-containing protein n=1 Tax=Artemisia annua TaxID=35608 RepID=A0A2U1M138_ARTAN|nr:cytochrome b561/ferric reductase transmembrane with DOMON related domain-containing protein [Artemisia annua]
MIHAQTQDSCSSNLNIAGSQLLFDTANLNCFPVWSSEGFILRYSQASPNLWNFVLSTPTTNSYIGMGFSPSGNMVGSSAVVGWIDSGAAVMKRYFLGGQTPSQVLVDAGNLQIFGNTSSLILDSSSSRLYLAFQLVTDGEPSRRLVFSVGDSSNPPPRSASGFRLTQHRTMAAIRLNYASGQASKIKAPYSNLKRTHGILNMFGWGILLPIGVIVARYFKHLDPLWFYVHTGIQSLGFILGLSGVIAGFVLDNKLEVNVRKHKGLGITILTLGCLQVLALLARPSIDAKTRIYWNWYHYSVGRIAIFFAIVNIFYGIHVADAGSSWNASYGLILGIFVVTTLVLEFMRLKKN